MMTSTAYRGFATVLLVVMAAGLLLVAPVRAQIAGAILSGRITDPSGAAVTDAKVVIKNLATGITTTVQTNNNGMYSAPNLLPGKYSLSASAPGFATSVESSIDLAVGSQPVLNLSLSVGQVTQEVQVAETAPAIQLANSSISAEVNERTVRELPLNARDWTQLATLQPGIVAVRSQAPTTSTSNRGNRGFGNELSDSGHRPYENNYRINGISVNDYSNGAPGSTLGVNLGVDAIQEFSVAATSYPAEYGKTSGGVINAITKSGSNDFHGNAYWFLRDEGMDARNYFDPPKIAPFHRNQFGASGGGPIYKSRTFFFADYEGVRQALGQSFHDLVPSDAARSGSLCSQPSLGTGTPCKPSTVKVDPQVAKFLSFWPAPTAGLSPTGHGDTGFFNASGNTVTRENYFTIRADHKLSDKTTLASSYLYDNAPQTFPDALLDSLNQNLSGRQMFTLEGTTVASSTFVNTARVGYSRTRGLVSAGLKALNPAAKDPVFAAVPGQYAPVVVVPGLTTFQGGFGSLSYIAHVQNSYQAYDDAFLSRGKHSLKFGFSFERLQYNALAKIRENGQFSFPSLQGFLQNQPTTVQLLSPFVPAQTVESRQSLLGAYVQDDWHAFSNLTLNLGVRYEFATLPSDAHNRFAVLLPDIYTGTITNVDHLWSHNPTNLNFEPRVGFSYDPFRNGRTAVRGAFGIFDVDPLPWVYTLGTGQALPFSLQVSASNLPQGSFPGGVAPLVAGNGGTNAGVRYVDPNPRRPFAMNWNFNVQRDLGWDTMVMVGYVGSHTLHLPENEQDSNMVIPTKTVAGLMWPVGATRLNPKYGLIRSTFFNGNAHYNGLDVQVAKHMAHGLQFQTAYTYGQCLDNGSSGATDSFLNSLQSPMFFSYQQTHGPCDFDIRNNFVANMIWAIPGPKQTSFIHRFVGGWELSALIQAATGSPFTPVMAGDPLGQKSSTPMAYPNRLRGGACDSATTGNPNAYINLNCFTPAVIPAGITASQLPFPCVAAAASVGIPNTCLNLLGNETRNSVRGPGLNTVDMALLKNNPFGRISDSFNMQFRVDVFNIFNHGNFQSPNSNDGNSVVLTSIGLPNASAGALVSTTTSSRQLQLSLKMIF